MPLVEQGSYAFWVDWGDGSSDYVESWDDEATHHEYDQQAYYDVEIVGTLQGWSYGDTPHDVDTTRQSIEEIASWGPLAFGDTERQFENCGYSALLISAADAPDLTSTTSLSGAFDNCRMRAVDLNGWNTSTITDMSNMFFFSEFDGDISSWDTSNVTDMSGMFEFAFFSGDISSWDTSSVTSMAFMFAYNIDFDGDVSAWDVSSVQDMSAMFLDGLPMTTAVYDALLINWASQDVASGVEFHAGSSNYSVVGQAARQSLIDDHDWTIIDDGLVQ